MSYRFQDRERIGDGVRRIADEQLAKAIAELGDDELGRHEGVHQARKRFKKIRGLLRLVRPSLGKTYSEENTWFRNIGRELSAVRDAEAMTECYDDLMDTFAEQVSRREFASVRRALTMRRKQVADQQVDLDSLARDVAKRLRSARHRAAEWSLDEEGFDAVAGGLAKTCGRGRDAMEAAYDAPSPGHFHEWRKRVKYHWYHCRLLRHLWPKMMKSRRKEMKRLSDYLGDAHDLDVFRATLLGEPERFGNLRDIEAIIALIGRREAELRSAARPLGQRVYAEKPKAFASRLGKYWRAWGRKSQAPAPALAGAAV